ncbi:MAG: CoA pyrophosphatase [Dehalococcoidia bacterium]|jgi:8-oxo-dGTP pyrophosphatase MutT (NUDIX family)|nr:CoA pyrophosphatase [Dehalococcoidia bacterium]
MTDVRVTSRRMLAGLEPQRFDGGDQGDHGERRAAAVMLLLYEQDGREHILFQQRTDEVEHHKGEISLPGGRRDHGDGSLIETALRETDEEIGVVRDHIEVFGSLDEIATRSSNYVIAPFAGAITAGGDYPFRMARREVKELLVVPLDTLRGEANVQWVVREEGGDAAAEREFMYGEHCIWGATARIVGQYLDLLTTATGGSSS